MKTQEELFNDHKEQYKNFSKKEIDCNCEECTHELWDSEKYDTIPPYFLEAMCKLQQLREVWNKPMRITSAHRCVKHNQKVGGAKSSKHLRLAFDVVVSKEEQDEFVKLAKEVGFNGIGRYPDNGFVHIDLLRSKLTEW